MSTSKASPISTNEPDVPHELPEDDVAEGLTDDERVMREDDHDADGTRVTAGPADDERTGK
jgi:hypothetical protein